MSHPPVLNTYAALLSTFSSFLTVAVHTILYERSIYPENTFLSARKYNYPVRQNRHPKICAWIKDAVAAVEAEMLKVRFSVWFVRYQLRLQPLHYYPIGFPARSSDTKVLGYCVSSSCGYLLTIGATAGTIHV